MQCDVRLMIMMQVAEMHGELMEFNDLLRRQLLAKDIAIEKLTRELTALKSPVCIMSFYYY